MIQKLSEETAEFAKEREKTEQIMQKNSEERAKADAEFAKERKKTEKMMQESVEERKKTAKIVKDMSESIEKTNKEFHKNFGNLGNDWGRMAENLVKGNLAQRFTDRGIEIEKVLTNIKNEISEFDIVAVNGTEIIIVEVKSRLGLDDVEKFLSQIKTFRENWPKIAKDKTIYGALAYVVKRSDQAFLRAKKEGLFVISVSGDILIENNKRFQPTALVN